MILNRRHLLGAFAATAAFASARAFAVSENWEKPALLPQALAALDRHGAKIAQRDLIGMVDFSLPSREARFHLVNVGNGRVEASYLVAHGMGSDPGNTGWAKRFSNRLGSNASSTGCFVTGDTYYGRNGHSRRLQGLDPENSNALERAIVIHGADYVDASMANREGRIGRSWGCFAVQERQIGEVLRRLGPGRMLFASQ